MVSGTFRDGTKNIRRSFNDELIKANGFQHKSEYGFTCVGDVEYRYTDLNTGEAKSQYLAIGTDGYLYKKKFQYIKFSSLGTATKYSYYYDSDVDSFLLKFDSYNEITVSETMTMDQLRVAINALGMTCTVVDENDVTITGSTKLAYYLDVVVDKDLSLSVISEMNSQFWQVVPSPSVPFPTTRDFYQELSYTGVSYVNINNSCVITDGGFPMKYDGYSVYRLGMPKMLAPLANDLAYSTQNYSNVVMTPQEKLSGLMESGGVYKYILQLGYVDFSGAEVVGGFLYGTNQNFSLTTLGASLNSVQNSIAIYIPNINIESVGFNNYNAKATGAQSIPSAGGNIDVDNGHNIKAGMCVRLPISNNQVAKNGYSNIISKVLASYSGYSGNGTTTNLSAVVSGLSSTSNIGVGSKISGTGIPLGARVLSVDSATQITMNMNATASATVAITVSGLINVEKGYTGTGILYPFQDSIDKPLTTTSGSATATLGGAINISTSKTSGSNIVTTASNFYTAGVKAGMFFVDGPFPAGTTVVSVDSATQITVSNNSAATSSGASSVYPDLTGLYITGAGVATGTTVQSQVGQTITLSANATANSTASHTFHEENTLIIDDQNIPAGYTQEIYENTITSVNDINSYNPDIITGGFVRVWRTIKNGDQFYKLIDIPCAGSEVTFIDTIPDVNPTSSLVDETSLTRIALEESDQGGDLPRACSVVTEWQNQIVQLGRPVNVLLKDERYPTLGGLPPVNDWSDPDYSFFGSSYTEAGLCDYQSIYWSSALSSEAFPQDGLNEFRVSTVQNDSIVGGIKNKDAFFAFKQRSTGVLVGSLAENNISIEILEDDIGCASHRSIQEVNGAVVWLDAVNGIYACVAGRLPVNIGYPVSDYQKVNRLGLNWAKAVSANFRKENLYICAVEGVTFVYDYADNGSGKRNCWYIWDRFNTKSLTSQSNDEFYLSDGSKQWKMKLTNTKYDCTDHKSAIDMIINTAWINLGQPSIDKNFIRLWVNSIQGGFKLDFYQYQNYLENEISSIFGVSFLEESYSKRLIKQDFRCAQPKMSATSIGMRNNNKNEYVTIQGYELELSSSYDTTEPKK